MLPTHLPILPFLAAILATAAFPTTAAPAAKKSYITTTLDVTSECKTCPRSLCPNVELVTDPATYEFNVTCWTRGTRIMGDTLWLKTGSDCYLTQYDVKEYEGNWDEDLAYCGRASEEQHLTLEDATLHYKSECRICPTAASCEVSAYLPEETDLELTCWTEKGTPVMDDPYWYKTTNNCYIAEAQLHKPFPSKAELDYCGPIPENLEEATHWNENGTSEINSLPSSSSSSSAVDREKRAQDHPLNIVSAKVGEEYSYCRASPDVTSEVQEVYVFNQTVWMQCVTERADGWWAQSTDFCYCRNLDFWDEPLDNFQMPLCEYFETPPSDKTKGYLGE